MMFCPNCGAKINVEDIFCSSCGARNDNLVRKEDLAAECAAFSEAHNDKCDDNTFPTESVLDESSDDSIFDDGIDEYDSEWDDIDREDDDSAFDDSSEMFQDDMIPLDNDSDSTNSEEQPGYAGDDSLCRETENKQNIEKIKKESQQEKYRKIVEKADSTKIGIGYRILSFFLCILLFAFVSCTAFLGIAGSCLNYENLSENIEKIGVSGISIGGESLSRIVYDSCSDEFLNDFDLDMKAIEEIVASVDYKAVVDNILMPYIAYYVGFDNELPQIEPGVVTEIIYSNKTEIYGVICEHAAKQADIEDIFSDGTKKYIEEQVSQVLDNVVVDTDNEDAVSLRAFVRVISEKFFYYCLIAICVLLGILILFANKIRFSRSLGDIGFVLIAAAVLLAIAYLAYHAVPLLIDIPLHIISLTDGVGKLLLIRIAAYAFSGIFAIFLCRIASFAKEKSSLDKI